jgi:hypothetical protein
MNGLMLGGGLVVGRLVVWGVCGSAFLPAEGSVGKVFHLKFTGNPSFLVEKLRLHPVALLGEHQILNKNIF